jgi:Lrp/AsnC family leucine-responsive transcriptional regulator
MVADKDRYKPGHRITQTDRTLLRLLKQDSWRTISELAAITGISRTSVKNRIDLMRDRGVIKRFTIETGTGDDAEKDCGSAFFLVRLKRPACRAVHASIKDWPELMGCWSISGDLDMIVLVSAPSNSEIERIREKLSRHPDIKGMQTLAILRDWNTDEARRTR